MASLITRNTETIIAWAILTAFIVANFLIYGVQIQTIIFAAVLVILSSWQLLKPAFPLIDISKSERWFINYALSLIISFISSFPAMIAAIMAQSAGWGLLNKIELPIAVVIIVSILVLDLLFYFLHKFVHMNNWFWKSHRVHHNDLVYDVSLVARDHPITSVLLSLGRIAVVLALGISPIGYGLYLLVLSITLPFIHSNVYLPPTLDRIIRIVFVTPNMHYVHHSSWWKETNSNYSVMFSWWDKIFGTYKAAPKNGHENMEVGLKEWRKQSELTLTKLLLMPFREK